MFDFGFTELMLVAVVALIVVGPQRLPKVARTAGHMLGRLQRYVSDVKSDISREMQLEDLKKLQQDVQEQARDLETSVRKQMNSVESEVSRTGSELDAGLTALGNEAEPGHRPPMPGDAAPVSESAPVAPDQTQGTGQPTERGPQLDLGLDNKAPDTPDGNR